MNRLLAFATSFLSACLAPVALADNPSPEKVWVFEVFLDRKPIGLHEFRVQADDEGHRVDIDARFDVRILMIKAWSYRHQNVERWDAGCLVSLESDTDVNGDPARVVARDEGKTFHVTTLDERQRLDRDCVMSFAYWTPDILEAQMLLNAQTGRMTPVTVSERGSEMRDIGEQSVEVDRYTLTTDEGDITLWYTRNEGLWVGLEAPAKGDRVLRYQPLDLPGNSRAPRLSAR